KKDADTGRWRLEHSVLDLTELDQRPAARIHEIQQVVFGKFPARDVLHDREKIDAVGVEFDLETGWARLTLQRGRAGAIAIGIREFPAADNALGGFAKLR